MKIAVAGTGYVGMSNSVLLAQHNEIVALDINEDRVDMINRGESTVEVSDISHFLSVKSLNSRATNDKNEAYVGAEYVLVATPNNYDPEKTYSIRIVSSRQPATFQN